MEIDETVVVRRKYGVGRIVEKNNVWLFGGVERGNNGNCFLVPLEGQQRNATTLLPLIQQHIRPGTEIHSDSWAVYNGILALSEGYIHHKANHKENFVAPQTGAHTQTVENQWRLVKEKFKRQFGVGRGTYDTYFPEFMWRKKFGDPNEVFFNFWSHVSHFYPCE